MAVQRLNYFHYQFLQERDFKDEQSYHVAMRRRHNQEFHTWGRVRGLDVSFLAGERKVTISPGTAVDSLGREIIFESNYEVDLQSRAGQTVYLTVAYREEATDPSTQPGVAGNFTRTTESFQTPRLSTTLPADPSLDVILARITLNTMPPDGAVTAVSFAERTEAGAKIGQADLPAVRFTVPTHGGSEWPRISGTNVSLPGTGVQGIAVDASVAAFTGSVNVVQNLTVQGDLNVHGVVNKVDELTIKDSIIRVNQYEPPAAVPVVVNGGLEVYRGGTEPNAQIIWDETVDLWRVGLATSLDSIARTSDLNAKFDPATGHRHTGAGGDGPQVSHAHLSSVVAADVTSTDATADRHVSNLQAKGWQDHVNQTVGTNPHGTTAALVGALPAADYGFASSVAVDVVFHNGMASGAALTALTNFRTKFVWITGTISAVLAGQSFGSSISGHADCRGPIIQRANGPHIHRLNAIPYVLTNASYYDAFAGASFFDLVAAPDRIEHVLVTLTSVTATGLVLTLGRSVPSTTTALVNPVTGFTIRLRLMCFA